MTRFLPAQGKTGLNIVLSFFSAVICLLLLRASWIFVLDEKEMGSLFFGSFPLWPWQLILPVGFAFFSLRFMLRSVEQTFLLIRGQEG